jgi:circadian clock protein KaiB
MQQEGTKKQSNNISPVLPFLSRHVFQLYVSSTMPSSARAIVNIRRICDQHLPEVYDLEIIDIVQFPARATQAQIVAAPTLIKTSPLPEQRFVGDMSQSERFLQALGLPIMGSKEL